jgi:hypothetical protein
MSACKALATNTYFALDRIFIVTISFKVKVQFHWRVEQVEPNTTTQITTIWANFDKKGIILPCKSQDRGVKRSKHNPCPNIGKDLKTKQNLARKTMQTKTPTDGQ